MMPLSDEYYVMKSSDKMFVEPHINLNFVDPEVIQEWTLTKKTIKEWMDLFTAAATKIEKPRLDENLVQRD